jgi:hypothetical protein
MKKQLQNFAVYLEKLVWGLRKMDDTLGRNFDYEERYEDEITDEKIEKAAKVLSYDFRYVNEITDLFCRLTLTGEQYEEFSRLNHFHNDWQFPITKFFGHDGKFDSVAILEKALRDDYYLWLAERIENILDDERELERLYKRFVNISLEANEESWKFHLRDVMTPSEAAERWGLKRNTIVAALNRGLFDDQIRRGLVRKHVKENGQTEWYITKHAMIEKYGYPKEEIE